MPKVDIKPGTLYINHDCNVLTIFLAGEKRAALGLGHSFLDEKVYHALTFLHSPPGFMYSCKQLYSLKKRSHYIFKDEKMYCFCTFKNEKVYCRHTWQCG